MNYRKPFFWLAVLTIVSLAASLCAAADTAIKDNAREYLALRQTLKATTLTPTQMSGPRSQWRGRAVELFGRISGRTNGVAGSEKKLISFMLQVPGGDDLIMVDCREENPLIGVDTVVHVLATLPDDARPSDHFIARGMINEEDLPVGERRYAEAEAAVQAAAAAAASLSTTPVQPTTDATADASPTDATADQTAVPPTAPDTPKTPTQPLSRPGTQMPQLSTSASKVVSVWKKWVGSINSKLTDDQLELIVRSVLYYSALHGVDHRLSFSMIKCESDFDPRCLSHVGAAGLCQLMPDTARGLGVDPWDIEGNINGGIKYLSNQLRAYASRSNYEQFALGLASYNAGPRAVKRAGGVPNIPETIRYVKKVGDLFYQLYKSGMP